MPPVCFLIIFSLSTISTILGLRSVFVNASLANIGVSLSLMDLSLKMMWLLCVCVKIEMSCPRPAHIRPVVRPRTSSFASSSREYFGPTDSAHQAMDKARGCRWKSGREGGQGRRKGRSTHTHTYCGGGYGRRMVDPMVVSYCKQGSTHSHPIKV